MGERRHAYVRPMNATAVDDHDDFFPCVAKEGHHLMDILAKTFGIKMGDDLREHFRGAILDGPDDAEQHPAGHTAPAPRAPPRLAFAGLVAFDVAAAEGPGGQAKALRFVVPPTCPGQGKTPENGCICLEHNALPPLSAVFQGGEFQRRPRQCSRVGSEAAGGPAGADGFFFRPRGHSHGSSARRSGGPRPWRVRANSTGKSRRPAGAGLDRPGD